MRAPDDLPRRRRRRPGPGGRGRAVLIVAVVAAVRPAHVAAGHRRLLHRLPVVRLARPVGRVAGHARRQARAGAHLHRRCSSCWRGSTSRRRPLAPPFRPAGPRRRAARALPRPRRPGAWAGCASSVAGLLALIAGSGVSAEWNEWLLFTNGGDFGVEDPQFGRDIGFYVFQLPFLSFVVDWLFAALLIVLIVTAVAHYLNGGIRVQPPSPRVTPQVKAHLSVLLAAAGAGQGRRLLAAAVRADRVDPGRRRRRHLHRRQRPAPGDQPAGAHLARGGRCCSSSTSAAGAGCCPLVAVGLWVFVAVVVGGIYPQFVQRFQVQPNESPRSEPYIERNIDGHPGGAGPGRGRRPGVRAQDRPRRRRPGRGAATIRNIRLWDPASDVSGQTFQQLQRIRDYYRISDIDVDRYTIDGEPTQVIVGVRDLNPTACRTTRGRPSTSPTPTATAWRWRRPTAREGDEPEFLVRRHPGAQPRAEGLSMEQPGHLLRRGPQRLRRGQHRAATRSTTRPRSRPSRPTYDGRRRRRRPARSSGGRRSPCASATSTR